MANPNYYKEEKKHNEPYIFSYDKEHKSFFQELIERVNQEFAGTKAEIPLYDPKGVPLTGEIEGMNTLHRMAIITALSKDSSLRDYMHPITPRESETLISCNKLKDYELYSEGLALILYNKKPYQYNPKEASSLKKEIIKFKKELSLSDSDLEKNLMIVNAGLKKDDKMFHKTRPVIVPGMTRVYHHDILDKIGEEIWFSHGLENGFPSIEQCSTTGNRRILLPTANSFGLAVFLRWKKDFHLWWPFLSGLKDANDRIYFTA